MGELDLLKPTIERAKQKLPLLQQAYMANTGSPAAEKAFRAEMLKTLQEINGSLNKQQITQLFQSMMGPAPQR